MEGSYEEVTIHEDGETFDVQVKGVKGQGCTELQKKYHGTGKQIRQNLTDEYYETPATVANVVQNKRGG